MVNYLNLNEIEHFKILDQCILGIDSNKKLIEELAKTHSTIDSNLRFLLTDQNDLKSLMIRLFNDQKVLSDSSENLVIENHNIIQNALNSNPQISNEELTRLSTENIHKNIEKHRTIKHHAELHILNFEPLYTKGKKSLDRLLFDHKEKVNIQWYEKIFNGINLHDLNLPIAIETYWLYLNIIYIRNKYIEHDLSSKTIGIGSNFIGYDLRLRLENLKPDLSNQKIINLHNIITDHWPWCDRVNAQLCNSTVTCLTQNIDHLTQLREKDNFDAICQAINNVGYFTPTLQEICLRLVNFFNLYFSHLKLHSTLYK